MLFIVLNEVPHCDDVLKRESNNRLVIEENLLRFVSFASLSHLGIFSPPAEMRRANRIASGRILKLVARKVSKRYQDGLWHDWFKSTSRRFYKKENAN